MRFGLKKKICQLIFSFCIHVHFSFENSSFSLSLYLNVNNMYLVRNLQQHSISRTKYFWKIKTYGKHIQYMYIYTCSWVLILSLCLVVFDYLPCTRRSQILCARGQGEIPLGATWWNNRNRINAQKNPRLHVRDISFLAVYIHRYCKTWSKCNFYW